MKDNAFQRRCRAVPELVYAGTVGMLGESGCDLWFGNNVNHTFKGMQGTKKQLALEPEALQCKLCAYPLYGWRFPQSNSTAENGTVEKTDG